MRLVERVGNLDGVLQDLLDRQRVFHEPLRQRLAFEIFHHQKINSVLMSSVVERANVRMIQTGDRFCFALEALAQFGPVGEMGGENFDGNNSIKPGVTSTVNLSHAARTDSGEDFVGP